MYRSIFAVLFASALVFLTPPAFAVSFSFSTGNPDGKIGTATRPSSSSGQEIETGDDFILNSPTRITGATFTGLLPAGASTSSVSQVVAEIYRVFPADSDVTRTSGSPNFSTPQVPTRVNSPSDVAFEVRDSSGNELSFSSSVLTPSFTVGNSIINENGINPLPNIFTGGDGSVTGQEVRIDLNFTDPFNLAPGHYFFVPQVLLTNGNFLWLSAPRPIVAPGTPFAPDLQSWIRDEDLQPDWLRIGTDITHQGPFNAAFSLEGTVVPEPGTLAFVMTGLAMLALWWRKRTV